MPERISKRRRCSRSYITIFENDAGSNIFSKLPAELTIAIFGHCSSLKDVHSLISASPAARACFLGNAHTYLKQHVTEIRSELIGDDLVALALLLLRLRRSRRETYGGTPIQVQQLVKPIVEAVLRLDPVNPSREWKGSLAQIMALRRFLPEIREFIASQQKDQMPDWARKTDKEPAELTTAQKHKFIDTFLGTDIYCHSFHHGHELFFQGKESKEKLSRYLNLGLFFYFTQDSRLGCTGITIPELIQNRQKALIDLVDKNFEERTSDSEQSQAREMMHRRGQMYVAWRRLRIRLYQRRSWNQEMEYLKHVSRQGYSLLYYMESLDLLSLEIFVYDTFFEVSVKQRQRQQEAFRGGESSRQCVRRRLV
ncbi:hypothetical protein ACHAP5_005359 [Fusarium lateritium]